ncbi:hypothetical protein [Paenarthrobacter sp. NPDC091669]|uniref:hypothetical protein n=1 Tax=Paenarthrobacter sp. NPDC091669 TaxID=3364384 RepID=UPI0037F8A014
MASSNLSLTRYKQGDWFGVVRNGTVVLLGPDTPHALIDTVWELLASAPEAHEVLHEVTDAFGVSLSRIPPFGIIDSKDALRVFLRGDLELLVQVESGAEQLTGRDVTTWTERRLAGATSYSLRIGGGSASGMPLNSLPLTEGVVLLSVLEAAPGQPGQSVRDGGPAIHATDVPLEELEELEEPAKDSEEQPAVQDRVSDETMIGYTEADLGLTIAPGQLSAGKLSNGQLSDNRASGGQSAADESPVTDESLKADEFPQTDGSPKDRSVAGAAQASVGSASAGESPAAGESSQPGALPHPDNLQGPETSDDAGEAAAEEPAVHTSTTDPLMPTLENTTNYDHLWDKTVMRNIEDAAVRVEEDSDDHDAPASKTPDAPEARTPETPVEQLPAPEPAARESVEQPSSAPQGSGLIDSVPWLRSSPATPEAASAPPGLSSTPAVPSIGSVPSTGAGPSQPGTDPAPQLPGAWPSAPPAGVVDEDSDHDGQTIMKSSLAAGNEDAAEPASAAPEAAVAHGPSVLARVCSQGHANPPTYPQCSVCGTALSGDAQQVQRPRLGRMRLSTGELIDLDQSLIIGRQPSVSRVQGGTMPRLVQVESPGGDISRSHVEVRLEGWHVMLCDLKATNGTVLIREGQAPRRLAQNEMAILLDGDIAELGDDISLRFEEIL